MQETPWQPAPPPDNEQKRLEVLQSYCVLDTPQEAVFETLTALGSAFFNAPVVLISLIDKHRQFFKSVVGLPVRELPRDTSFCGYTILQRESLVVLNTAEDERFRNNPLVLGAPEIRFYAGAPLVDRSGVMLGSFCVIDNKPREQFTAVDQENLKRFASLTVDALEKRLYPSRLNTAQEAVEEANERYHLATQATTDGIWDWDCHTDLMFLSARLCFLIGLEAADTKVPRQAWFNRIHPSDLEVAKANVRRLRHSGLSWFELEYRIQHEDGTWRWMHNRGIAVRGPQGTLVRVVGALADITARKFVDPLTGLHTRASLIDALEQGIKMNLDQGHCDALLLFNLDGFRRANANLGRQRGDQILMECTQRLTDAVADRSSSLIAHIAGDEFAILLRDISDTDKALAFADRVREALQRPFHVEGRSVSLTLSIGIAFAHESCNGSGHLMQWADVARHESKVQGGGRTVVFSGEMQEQAIRRMTLASDLREALAQDNLTLHYQPKVDLRTEEMVGFEALARWQHPTLGSISPAEFVPIAEECDLIQELGRWTLQVAIRQLAQWRAVGIVGPGTTVAVNLSARQFSDPDLVENILRKLRLHDLPPSCLLIEVTESILITDQDEALRILTRLKSLGIGLDLDDFGTGYSSMSYLHQFPFDSLKIDRSFITHMNGGVGAATIVRSIVALGKALGLRVVAEGIEDEEQLRALRELGCDYGQGYFFAQPLDADAMVEFANASTLSPAMPR